MTNLVNQQIINQELTSLSNISLSHTNLNNPQTAADNQLNQVHLNFTTMTTENSNIASPINSENDASQKNNPNQRNHQNTDSFSQNSNQNQTNSNQNHNQNNFSQHQQQQMNNLLQAQNLLNLQAQQLLTAQQNSVQQNNFLAVNSLANSSNSSVVQSPALDYNGNLLSWGTTTNQQMNSHNQANFSNANFSTMMNAAATHNSGASTPNLLGSMTPMMQSPHPNNQINSNNLFLNVQQQTQMMNLNDPNQYNMQNSQIMYNNFSNNNSNNNYRKSSNSNSNYRGKLNRGAQNQDNNYINRMNEKSNNYNNNYGIDLSKANLMYKKNFKIDPQKFQANRNIKNKRQTVNSNKSSVAQSNSLNPNNNETDSSNNKQNNQSQNQYQSSWASKLRGHNYQNQNRSLQSLYRDNNNNINEGSISMTNSQTNLAMASASSFSNVNEVSQSAEQLNNLNLGFQNKIQDQNQNSNQGRRRKTKGQSYVNTLDYNPSANLNKQSHNPNLSVIIPNNNILNSQGFNNQNSDPVSAPDRYSHIQHANRADLLYQNNSGHFRVMPGGGSQTRINQMDHSRSRQLHPNYQNNNTHSNSVQNLLNAHQNQNDFQTRNFGSALDNLDLTKQGKIRVNKKKRVTSMKKKIKIEREERRQNRVDQLARFLNPSEEIPTLPKHLIQNIVDMILEDEQQNDDQFESALEENLRSGMSSQGTSRASSVNNSRSQSRASQVLVDQSDSRVVSKPLSRKERRKLKQNNREDSVSSSIPATPKTVPKQLIARPERKSRTSSTARDKSPEGDKKLDNNNENDNENNEKSEIIEENMVNRLPVEFPGIHSRRFREYCNQVLDANLDQNVIKLIESVKRKQDKKIREQRNKAEELQRNNRIVTKHEIEKLLDVKKSIVMGLREVTKHAKAGNLKLVVIAPNLEKVKSKGGLDDAVDTLKQACATLRPEMGKHEETPCCFALSKVALGRALGRNVPISAIGIRSVVGLEKEHKKVVTIIEDSKTQYDNLCSRYLSHVKKYLTAEEENEELSEHANGENQATNKINTEALNNAFYIPSTNERTENNDNENQIISESSPIAEPDASNSNNNNNNKPNNPTKKYPFPASREISPLKNKIQNITLNQPTTAGKKGHRRNDSAMTHISVISNPISTEEISLPNSSNFTQNTPSNLISETRKILKEQVLLEQEQQRTASEDKVQEWMERSSQSSVKK